eukprot:g8717.t1
MNRFRVSSTGGGQRSAVASGAASGSPASSSISASTGTSTISNNNTDASGGSSRKDNSVPHEFGPGPDAGGSSSSSSSSSSNSNSSIGDRSGTFHTPLPSTPSPGPGCTTPSSLLPSSSASSPAAPSPWPSLSAAASSPGDSNSSIPGRKRRMVLDAEFPSDEKGPSFFDGGNNRDSVTEAPHGAPSEPREVSLDGGSVPRVSQPDGDHGRGDGRSPGEGPFLLPSRSSLPPPPPPSNLPPGTSSSSSSSFGPPFSLSGGNGKQRVRQAPPPAALHGCDGDARSGPDGSASGGGGPAPRGRSGESPSTERPSTPAPPVRHGQRGQPATLTVTSPSPNLSSSCPPVDTTMEDHDRFDEISRAEELALAAAAASIEKAENRQLAVREGIAITHSRLLQSDNMFKLRADAEKLLEATQSLLQDLGLDPEDGVATAAAAEAMDQEEDDTAAPPPSSRLQGPERQDG